jgi:hypothetical protein
LGGQPASGKSDLIKLIASTYNNNFLVINGDEYRIYHPEYTKLIKDIKNYPKETQPYSNIFTENLIQEAIRNKYNLIVEGTMRNPDTPMKTAQLLRNNGYEVHAAIIASHPKITELGVYERFNNEVVSKGFGRLADINSHNEACQNLLKSADRLYETKCVDAIHIFTSYPIREIKVLALKDDTWGDSMFPSIYIREERDRQINDKIFVSTRIDAGWELSKTIKSVLKSDVEKIVSDLIFYQS